MWTIYCVTHIASGRRYVGQTRLSLNRRWKGHVANAKKYRAGHGRFAGAIRKYGTDAFTTSILETCETVVAANDAEAAWIEAFSTRFHEYGFNTLPGGRTLAKYESAWDRPGMREAASERARALWNDPEYRARCTASGGATLTSPEVRAKIAATKGTPEWRAAQSSRSKEIHARPEVKAKKVAAWKDTHSSSEGQARRAEGDAKRSETFAARTHCRKGHEMTPENTYDRGGNIRDCRKCAADRARAKRVPKPKRTHCRRGHEFTPDNVVALRGGDGRACRTCALERRQEKYKAAREAGLSAEEARKARSAKQA